MLKSGEFYPFEIKDVVLAQTTNEKKTPFYEFLLLITDTANETSIMKHRVYLAGTVYSGGKHAGKTQREVNMGFLAEQFGLPSQMDTESMREYFRGKTGRAKLETNTYEGKTSLQVQGMYSGNLRDSSIDPNVLAQLNNLRFTQFKPASPAVSQPPKAYFKK